MGVIDTIKSPLNEKAKYLLEVYKNTNQAVAKTDDLDDQFLAYSEALNQCVGGKCNKEDEEKRNAVLYWAYHNMGDALVNKNFNSAYDFDQNNFEKALNYYNAALPLTSVDEDKVKSMHKIAKVHRHMNDEKSWLEVRQKLIDFLPNSDRVHAYVNLANEYAKSPEEEMLLEKALSYVKYENVSDKIKNRNILHICKRLIEAYERDGKEAKLRKVKGIYDATKKLMG